MENVETVEQSETPPVRRGRPPRKPESVREMDGQRGRVLYGAKAGQRILARPSGEKMVKDNMSGRMVPTVVNGIWIVLEKGYVKRIVTENTETSIVKRRMLKECGVIDFDVWFDNIKGQDDLTEADREDMWKHLTRLPSRSSLGRPAILSGFGKTYGTIDQIDSLEFGISGTPKGERKKQVIDLTNEE